MKSPLQEIPGVGQKTASVMEALGIRKPEDLRGQDPDTLYLRECLMKGFQEDRCALYVWRAAVYYAEHPDPAPEKLKWWYWKDKPYPEGKELAMNLPNKLTMLRIILTPVFMAVLYWGFPGADYVALAIFIIASLTDLLDGKIARKYNLITDFGKFADPLADKILVVAAMLWFVEVGRMPAWALLVVLIREFAVSGLRMVASDQGRVIAAGWSGKVKTAATMVCIIIMLFLGGILTAYQANAFLTAVPFDLYIARIDAACVWIITLTTLYSGIEYFLKNKDVIRSA